MRRKLLLMGIGLLGMICSCDSNIQNVLDAQYDGDKIALTGFLSPDSVHIVISRSINPLGDFQQKQFALQNPRVYLLNEKDSILREIFSPNQRDFGWGPANLSVGKSYRIRATAEGLTSVETDLVTIPPAVEVNNIQYRLDTYGNDTVHQLSFSLIDAPGKNYYAFAGALKKGNFFARPFILLPDEAFNLGCYSQGIFSDRCFAGQSITLTYLLFRDAGFPGESTRQRGEAMAFRFGTVSEQAYLQNQTIPIDDGIIEGLNDPPLAFSNVKNGYGLIFAYNVKTYFVPFK